MKKIAVEKARTRLERAREAIGRAAQASALGEFENAWTDFLIALNTVSVVLEKGARDNPRSRQWWFSQKKIEISKDPLLSYPHQARNTDEHGLDPVTERVPETLRIGMQQSIHIHHLIYVPGKGASGSVSTVGGEPLRMAIVPAHCRLTAVVDDRFGTIFESPSKHLGERLTDNTALAVGKLGLAYYEHLLCEASERA